MEYSTEELNRRLSEIAGHRPLVILGVGSELRGDDAWPFHLIESLKQSKCEGVHYFWGATLPESLTKPIAALKPEMVLICDSADIGIAPGTFNIFNAEEIAPEGPLSHRMSLRSLAELLAERTGCKVYFLLMQPKDIEFGFELSEKAKNGLENILNLLNGMLK